MQMMPQQQMQMMPQQQMQMMPQQQMQMVPQMQMQMGVTMQPQVVGYGMVYGEGQQQASGMGCPMDSRPLDRACPMGKRRRVRLSNISIAIIMVIITITTSEKCAVTKLHRLSASLCAVLIVA